MVRGSSAAGTDAPEAAVPRSAPEAHLIHASPTSDEADRLWTVIATAQQRGWDSCEMSIDDALEIALASGATPAPTRRGEADIAVLRPSRQESARRDSLSGKYGLGAFPLHTDGAHLRVPPDIVLLQATVPAHAATLLLRPNEILLNAEAEALKNGVFSVRVGRAGFYSHALNDIGLLRFDPGCMQPLDPLARRAYGWLLGQTALAVPYGWKDTSNLLVIDNTRTLHGRSSVAPAQPRELRRLALHLRTKNVAV